jgi:hypothetical protein
METSAPAGTVKGPIVKVTGVPRSPGGTPDSPDPESVWLPLDEPLPPDAPAFESAPPASPPFEELVAPEDVLVPLAPLALPLLAPLALPLLVPLDADVPLDPLAPPEEPDPPPLSFAKQLQAPSAVPSELQI